MISIEGIKLRVKRLIIKLASLSVLESDKAQISDVTFISNNCWAGFVHARYNVPFNTPTIGLFIYPEDFIKLSKYPKSYFSNNLVFINPRDSKYRLELQKDYRFGTYPIGRLGDIEIIFLHYSSSDEALEKWNRRVAKINWDKLVFKLNDQNGCTEKQAKEFRDIDGINKIFFSKKWDSDINKSCVFYTRTKTNGSIQTSNEPIFSIEGFNLIDFLEKTFGE